MDCEEIEAREKTGEDDKQIVLKQIYNKKKSPLFPYGLMFLRACVAHSVTRQTEAGASSSLKSLLDSLMQHCNRQQAGRHSQVATLRLPVGFIFSQPCYVWQMSLGWSVGGEIWQRGAVPVTKTDNRHEECSSLSLQKAVGDKLSNRTGIYWYRKTTHTHTHTVHSSLHKTLYSTLVNRVSVIFRQSGRSFIW